MKLDEDEIQKSLERGETPEGAALDVKAYKAVFRALKKDPGYKLPANFAAGVVERVSAKKQTRDSIDYLWFAAGVFLLAVASLATIMYTGLRLDLGFLKQMSDYQGFAVFAVAFIVFLNWLDKRLVRDGQAQH